MRIAFVPIDNRPVCYTLPEQIAGMDGDIELFLPPREQLGGLQKNADIDGLFQWLSSLDEFDCVIVSLDTLAYGGLIPSRRSNDTFEQIKNRIDKFVDIVSKKNAKIYAFSSIMRISNNNVNEEEKEYWNLYGKKIFEYSYNVHKNAPSSVETDIPEEILNDYLATRKRNFDINQYYLEISKETKLFEMLVFSKDDCAQFGLNVAEAQKLELQIKQNNLKATVKTGADEIPLSLLSRAITDNGSQKLKIFPMFTNPKYVDKISKYEDVSVYNSVKGQIELAGAEVSSYDEADIVIFVNNFQEEQGELVMGVEVEGNAKNFNLPEKPYLICDILNANGADNDFVDNLLKKNIDCTKFLGYAAWNTTGNTLGSALCCAIVKYCAKDLNIKAFKKVQVVRFLDDWAYQANVRSILKKNYLTVSKCDMRFLKEEIQPFEQKIKVVLGGFDFSVEYSFPWDRFFEVEIEYHDLN